MQIPSWKGAKLHHHMVGWMSLDNENGMVHKAPPHWAHHTKLVQFTSTRAPDSLTRWSQVNSTIISALFKLIWRHWHYGHWLSLLLEINWLGNHVVCWRKCLRITISWYFMWSFPLPLTMYHILLVDFLLEILIHKNTWYNPLLFV